jgi:predicted  nucleic acid-binding Zn ribbon protein
MVDKNFYDKEYCGIKIDDGALFNQYNAKAQRQVNQYCNFYFDNHTLDDLPLNSDRTNVKNSICAQIEYFSELGSTSELAGDGQVTSIHIGNTTKNYSHVALDKNNATVSSQAIEYLAPTGLLYRGVGQYG